MSQAAHEVLLDRGLADFADDLEGFLDGKETFLEDFYRRLKEVLGRCKSWRYQGILSVSSVDIVSRKQVGRYSLSALFNPFTPKFKK